MNNDIPIKGQMRFIGHWDSYVTDFWQAILIQKFMMCPTKDFWEKKEVSIVLYLKWISFSKSGSDNLYILYFPYYLIVATCLKKENSAIQYTGIHM